MAVPAQTPVEMVPTEVNDELTTPVPNVFELNTDVPLILNTLPVEMFVSPATSKVYEGAVTLLIPTLLLTVSTLTIVVPSNLSSWIPVVELAPFLMVTFPLCVNNVEDTAVPEYKFGVVSILRLGL